MTEKTQKPVREVGISDMFKNFPRGRISYGTNELNGELVIKDLTFELRQPRDFNSMKLFFERLLPLINPDSYRESKEAKKEQSHIG